MFLKNYRRKASRFQCCAKFHRKQTNTCRVGNWEIPQTLFRHLLPEEQVQVRYISFTSQILSISPHYTDTFFFAVKCIKRLKSTTLFLTVYIFFVRFTRGFFLTFATNFLTSVFTTETCCSPKWSSDLVRKVTRSLLSETLSLQTYLLLYFTYRVYVFRFWKYIYKLRFWHINQSNLIKTLGDIAT